MGFRVPCGRGVASGALDAWGHLLVVLAAFSVYCLLHCLLLISSPVMPLLVV